MEKYKGRPIGNDRRSEVEVNTYDFLDRIGVSYETVCHPAAYTMEQCQEVQGMLGGGNHHLPLSEK